MMNFEENWLGRTELLLGEETMTRLRNTRVVVFGVGGVGGWCAESLVRSGIGHVTIVDSDCVNSSNINRQLVATTRTVGQPKVEVLKARLLEINPALDIEAVQRFYCEETATDFALGEFDYVIDAIDSLADKALLIRQACDSGATLFSSMGAAKKMDMQRIRVAEFWKVQGCPLAAALRRRFKKTKEFPSRKFKCVYSDELLENRADAETSINGTMAHATAIFGFTLAGLVVQDVCAKAK